jgi:hypothetical protein
MWPFLARPAARYRASRRETVLYDGNVANDVPASGFQERDDRVFVATLCVTNQRPPAKGKKWVSGM